MAGSYPSQKQFWAEVVPQIEAAVHEHKEELARLVGIFVLFGPKDKLFTGQAEIEQCIGELVKFLVLAMAYELDTRQAITESAATPSAGRPRNHMIRYLGPQIVGIFHRYSDSGGRHSVWTSVDGRLVQEEAGSLFLFASLLISVFNAVMVTHLGLAPLSAARVIRYGLAERARFYAPEYELS